MLLKGCFVVFLNLTALFHIEHKARNSHQFGKFYVVVLFVIRAQGAIPFFFNW